MAPVSPLVALGVGVAIVLLSILWLRLNPFFGLIVAAMAVSMLAPGEPTDRFARVAEAFGATAGAIGIAIALAAVIGACMIASGAADRVVVECLATCGERHGASALAGSGFVLSIPVFFDTVFYLLFPLAQSMYRRTGRDYLKYLLAIGAGGAVTHTMVPPTPGPLMMANALGVDVGLMMLVGLAVGMPMAVSGLIYADWIGRRLKIEHAEDETLAAPSEPVEDGTAEGQPSLPGLRASLAPIVLPVAMIVAAPAADALLTPEAFAANRWWIVPIADKNLALLVAMIAALAIYVRQRRPSRQQVAEVVEHALTSAGVIVLITAAGGAFGGMLKAAGVGEAITELVGSGEAGGWESMWVAFILAALIKSSQGSTTVAIVTASSIVAAMQTDGPQALHPVYLCSAIGSGAMISSWMNDSGFWLFCKMGGLTGGQGMRTWAPMTAIMGLVGMATTVLLAWMWPGV